jgi:polysaccharide deacetylase family protein (PEP-CTERM system associated)
MRQENHIATVLLQDYFHRGDFREVVGERQWTRFESRLDRNVDETCELLAKHGVTATFFALGWIADQYPELIKRVVKAGHEIASAGYSARAVHEMQAQQFRVDVAQSIQALEAAAGQRVIGYRSGYGWIGPHQHWALDILRSLGFMYDGSYYSGMIASPRLPGDDLTREVETAHGTIWELPVSTARFGLLNLPISGGNYIRQLPHSAMFRLYERWVRRHPGSPFVLYFHPWELDSEQPVISAFGPLARAKQYRNLGKMREVLPRYFEDAPFVSVSEYLGVTSDAETRSRAHVARLQLPAEDASAQRPSTPVSVVVPCYNEHDTLPYLSNSLEELVRRARNKYAFEFVFVDDHSTDETLADLRRMFGSRDDCRIVTTRRNMGVAGAIMTGIRESEHEIICSIDADCSYDPVELVRMIPLLANGADMVTASPYHPTGFVLGVPKWRLFLSEGLSRLYHILLRHKLWTYTSCFRVYRRSAVRSLEISYGDFRGIVQLLAEVDFHGGTIVEFPTTLQSRIFGYSKMKTLKAIMGHIALLSRNIPRAVARNGGTPNRDRRDHL